MIKEKVKSEAHIPTKPSKMRTQMVSLSLASTKKTNFSNSKLNSFRQNSNIKFKTTKSSPEKTLIKHEDIINKPKKETKILQNNNNYNTHNIQKEIEKKANDFMRKKITKQQNKSKTKSNHLNFTNPVHPKNNIAITNNKPAGTNNTNKIQGNTHNIIVKSHKTTNSNTNPKNFFQIKKNKISQTTPVTNQNSRKTSAEKKIIANNQNNVNPTAVKYLVQNKKKSALSNITQHNPQKSSGSNQNNTNNIKNVLSFSNNSVKPHCTSTNSPSHYLLNFNKYKTQSKNDNEGKSKEKTVKGALKSTSQSVKKNHVTASNSKEVLPKNKQNINNSKPTSAKINNNIRISSVTKPQNSLSKSTSHSIGKRPNSQTNSKFQTSKPKNKSGNITNNNNKLCLPISNNYKSKSTSKSKLLKNNTNNIKNIKIKNTSQNRENSKDKTKPKTNSLSDNNLNDHSLSLHLSEPNIKEQLIKEGTYHLHEAQTLSNYIKQYFLKYNNYPSTNVSFYKFGRLIGRGAFGKVNLGLHVLSGKIVAIKSFNKTKFTNKASVIKIYKEVNLMKKLNHNSIVKLLETLETDKYILIIMENIAGGDLLNFIKKRTKLNEKTARIIFKQLVKSIKYLHSNNIIHRDIKLDNILIDLNNNIKLCDFGISKKINKGDILTDQCGTPAYIAPEIISSEKGYEGPPVDLWSSGVVLYAMLSGTVPFRANNHNDLHKLIIKGYFSEIKDISREAKDLLHSLLEVNPKKRITVDQVLEHPWLIGGEIDNPAPFFTKAEIVLLSKANVDYKNCTKEEIIENFTLKNLDTGNDIENKNITSKSVILAPFNSSIENKALTLVLSPDPQLTFEQNLIQFNTRTKVQNRNYELNNNGEIDHGILINHSRSQSQVVNSNSINIIDNNNKSPNNKEPSNKLTSNNSPHHTENKKISEGELSSKKDSQRNVNSLVNNSSAFIIDDSVVGMVENLGYKSEYMYKWLNNSELNYATATYFLLAKFNSSNNPSC